MAAVVGDFDLSSFDFGPSHPAPGEPGGPPAPVTDLPENRTIDVFAYLGRPGGEAELRRLLSEYGIELMIHWRPVAPAADGRLFGVVFPDSARFDQRHRLVLEHGLDTPLIAQIGRAARPGERPVLTIYDALPDVRDAVDTSNPSQTGERLRALGYDVRWKLVVDNPDRDRPGSSPTGWKDVAAPPPGTEIVQVLNAHGGTTATPQTRALMIELAPTDSEIVQGHRT